MAAKFAVLVISATAIVPAAANAFLKATSSEKQLVAMRAIEETLLTELALVGRDEHLTKLQDDLRPMFAALPKNADDKLDAAVVRYALHRFFVQSRGWYVQGLQPSGEMWNSSSPAELVKDRVPSFIQGLLKDRMHGDGLTLEDLAAFAATIQDLVHSEAVQNLMDTFSLLRLSQSGQLSEEQLSTAVEAYLMGYILNVNISSMGGSDLSKLRKDIVEVYPAWPDVYMWAKDLQQTILAKTKRSAPFAQPVFDFDRAAKMVEEVGYHFGSFQDQECRAMKDTLVDLEFRGTGRVLLSDFYRNSLEGNWQFSESPEYLRAMGALDESDPRRPSVIIANYVGSQSNCLASSSFYSVCCLDECEGLMSHLENAIGEPTAEPSHIAQLVASMSSDTIDAPRVLSPGLLSRLDEIAQHHGGRVPLHGRLFAQFMHHAYPRECPFPHTSGTTNPMTPDEWMAKHGVPEASSEEIRRHVSGDVEPTNRTEPVDVHEVLPWTTLEELVAVHEASRSEQRPSVLAAFAKVVLLVAFGSLSVPRLRATMQPAACDDKLPRYLV